jgi:hypothetical protein
MNADEHHPLGPHESHQSVDNEGPEHSESPTDDDPMLADLGAALRAALAPHNDVRDKARHRVDRALQARSATFGLTSMGSCAIDTLRHLLTNPPRVADRYSMTESRHTAGTENQIAVVQDQDPNRE